MWSGFRRGDRRRAGPAKFCTAGIAGRRRIQRTPARQQAFGEFKGRRRDRRGASPPANPYFFVRKHHALSPTDAAGATGVVPHPPQTLFPSSGRTTPSAQLTPPAGVSVVPHPPQILIPSSGRTTPLSQTAPPAGSAWCLIPRKPLFLRPEAPRP